MNFRDDDEEPSHKFSEYIHLFKLTSKEIIERVDLLHESPSGSSDFRIHTEILHEKMIPKVQEMASVIYGAIRTYNEKPGELPYADFDILKAQLALDEITDNLGKAGITLIFYQE